MVKHNAYAKVLKTVLVLVFSVLILASCDLFGFDAPDKYELKDGETIPSITSVVGERAVRTRKIGLTDIEQQISYTYKDIESPAEDVKEYVKYLVERGFKNTTASHIYGESGEVVLTKNSDSDPQYKITLTVTYSEGTYKVSVVRAKNDY